MPLTLAHPAIAIPLRNVLGRFGVLSALVIGSTIPDLVYFWPVGTGRVQSHSVAGLFWFCLPAGIAAYLLFHWLLTPVLGFVAPYAIKSRLHPRFTSGDLPETNIVSICVSLLVGATTHLVWDSVTHETGYLVSHLPLLQTPLFDLGGYRFFTYKVLQHASTLIGCIIILYLLSRWFHRTEPDAETLATSPTTTVKLARILLVGVPLVVGLASLRYEGGDWLESLRMPLGQFITTSGGTLLAVGLLLGLGVRIGTPLSPAPSQAIGQLSRRKFLLSASVLAGALGLSTWYWGKRWKYIVIHHSAGAFGNIEFLQKVHRQRQSGDPIDAIPYHYIIGNGNGLGMGDVASDWRERYNLWGAHVSGNNSDRNYRGIGICLIGNFEQTSVPPLQYDSLVTLTKKLMSDNHIPASHVSGHGLIHGESTKCPGKHFPIDQFLRDIA